MMTKDLVAGLPDEPGVYLLRNLRREVLYIGKAKSLRKRVRQYTGPPKSLTSKVRQLVRRVHHVEWEAVGSELEALLVESRLIKEHQPPFNAALKHLRRRPFLKIERGERFPRVVLAWEIERDGCDYFGPFPSRSAAEDALQLLHGIFPLRSCADAISPRPTARPCLDAFIGRCLAPCACMVGEREYDRLLESACDFLLGRDEGLHGRLLRERDEACARLAFEHARVVQNRIEAIERFRSRNPYQVNAVRNSHLVVVRGSRERGHRELFCVRGGALARHERVPHRVDERALMELVADVYLAPAEPGRLTLLDVDAMNILSQWLYRNRNDQGVVRLGALTAEACASAAAQVAALLLGPSGRPPLDVPAYAA